MKKINRQSLLNALWPTYCLWCKRKSDTDLALCADCQCHLPHLLNPCIQCAHQLQTDNTHCADCLTTPPYFDDTIALFNYENPIRDYISQYKFHAHLHFAKLFSDLLFPKLTQNQYTGPDALVAVPLHKDKLKSRGFNQSFEIAKRLHKQTKLPLLIDNVIRKKKHTCTIAFIKSKKIKKFRQCI